MAPGICIRKRNVQSLHKTAARGFIQLLNECTVGMCMKSAFSCCSCLRPIRGADNEEPLIVCCGRTILERVVIASHHGTNSVTCQLDQKFRLEAPGRLVLGLGALRKQGVYFVDEYDGRQVHTGNGKKGADHLLAITNLKVLNIY